jgi:hypothetical protein
MAVAVAASGAMLPERLGEFARGPISAAQVVARDRHLFSEYGLRDSESAEYLASNGHSMPAEVLRFRESEGARAAYLCLRPRASVKSPLNSSVSRPEYLTEIHACIEDGVTTVCWKNFIFRFRGAAPSIKDFERVLGALPDTDPAEPSWDASSPYLDPFSERSLLGPISLAKFAGRIPPSVAAFRLGATGSIAKFETPAGPMPLRWSAYPGRLFGWPGTRPD